MTQLPSHTDRRVALKLLAGAIAGATARCSRPEEEIIPYADMPEGLVAGEPMRFATTLSLSGYGRGFLGISVDGRPIKIEGNPRHPFSLGATDVFAEAEVLSLYDADRSRVARREDRIATWDDFIADWKRFTAEKPDASLALVTGRVLSPTTLLRIEALRKRLPRLRWYRYEPVNDDDARAGARLAFGKVLTAVPRWVDANVVLCLGADPLGHGPDQLRVARAYASRRQSGMRQRIHVAEPAWTLTGAAADFRLPLHPGTVREVARLIANALGANLGEPGLDDAARRFAEHVSVELSAAPGRALVLAGEGQPPEAQALCHWINARLHAPVDYLSSPDPVEADHAGELVALADDLHGGRVDALVIIGANPVYEAPDQLRLGEAIAAAPFSAHLGLYRDETAKRCHWHLPFSHPLESWGDERAIDGTASLTQPLIQRLYDSRTRDEFLSQLAGEVVDDAYQLTRDTWRARGGSQFETWWRQSLHDGVIADTRESTVAASAMLPTTTPSSPPQDLSLTLSPDPALWDGRYANNAWLQECPKPFTKEVWGNAVGISTQDAERFGIADGEAVELDGSEWSVKAAVTIMPGQAEGVLSASWGQGRANAGRIGTGIGTRFLGLGTRPFARVLTGIALHKSRNSIPFRSTQAHTRLRGRAEDLFPLTTPARLEHDGDEAQEAPASFLRVPARGEYAWSMVIDTDACIGCNACVVACQAENNVPIVGPEEISRGRDMHWLRVDAYARSESAEMRRGFQPVPCMHCELAPCEPVCPVEASVHDREGLNVQVYNRCIGTRFCEANCPYKVRRFNWFAYADGQAYAGEGAALEAQHNPDVSARSRGVMEKCNYCLQRISRARKTAEKESRPVAESEVVTACQAACPTGAIHFGDLNRRDSEVSRLRQEKRHYTLLAELNTRPRTTYLKRVFNSEDDSNP